MGSNVVKVIQSYLEPCTSSDELSVERYTGANRDCIELIQKDIKIMNATIQMNGLNIETLIQKALHSESAEVFKY